MLDHPGLPPRPPAGGLDFWSEWPNSWDLEMMEWNEEMDAFARQLRAQFWAMMQSQPIPMSKYKDGDLKITWKGKAHAVSKNLYVWMNKASLDKSEDAAVKLKEWPDGTRQALSGQVLAGGAGLRAAPAQSGLASTASP